MYKQIRKKYIHTHILIIRTRGNDIPVAVTISNIQIPLSKHTSPLKGTRAPQRNKWFWT